jgi:hypothetical protein
MHLEYNHMALRKQKIQANYNIKNDNTLNT